MEKLEKKNSNKICVALAGNLILIIIILLYLILGVYIFKLFEFSNSEYYCLEIEHEDRKDRAKTGEELVKIIKTTGDTNKSFELIRNYSRNVLLRRFNYYYSGQNCYTQSNWNDLNVFLFAVTVITSIGYGYPVGTPSTDYGKIILICYATLGIPMFIILITKLSKFLGKRSRQMYSKISYFIKYQIKKEEQKETNKNKQVPLTVVLLMVVGYLSLGAVIFTNLENGWSFMSAVYFCFVTLATIGFGDLVIFNLIII